jgi:hypothetical protein
VPYRQRLIKTFLSKLLPENPAVQEVWEKRYHVSRNNPFGLLKHVDEDVSGALQFVQPDRLHGRPTVRSVKCVLVFCGPLLQSRLR